jgi:hypothetical protein
MDEHAKSIDTEQPATEHNAVNRAAGFEVRDINLWAIAKAAIGLALFITAANLICLWLFQSLRASAPNEMNPWKLTANDAALPVEPRLEGIQEMSGSGPTANNAALKAAQQKQLEQYGWVDRTAGTVHIPIDAAMRMLVDRKSLEPISQPQNSEAQK